jgi:hypothetical protein
MKMLKWHHAWDQKKWIHSPEKVESVRVLSRWMTKKELLAPLSKSDMNKFDKYYERYGKK